MITPSLPTLSIASASISPISASPFAEIVPTCLISSFDLTFFARFAMSSTTAITALSIPRLRSIGLRPADTAFTPSRTIAWARTVAVVVPSPEWSFAFEATSRINCAPMFCCLSFNSISFATETPSFVVRGAPNDFSITTLRPFGPNVTFTAFAITSTPFNSSSRACSWNSTSLAPIINLL